MLESSLDNYVIMLYELCTQHSVIFIIQSIFFIIF